MSKAKANLWIVFWPVQILALLGIIFTSPNWLYLFMGWVLFCGLGSAVILHKFRLAVSDRSKIHSTFVCYPMTNKITHI